MPRLIWDKVGDRIFETGVDKCALYISGQPPVPWNGLVSVTENAPENKNEAFYLDGRKLRDLQRIGAFSGSIQAFTYPDEFLACEGVLVKDGLLIDGQRPARFSLVYRTLIGNDLAGSEHGYKIHILYNLTAIPETIGHTTQLSTIEPVTFGWSISGTPEPISGFYPTSHIIFDTRFLHPYFTLDLEQLLYGSDISDPALPSISELMAFATDWEPLWVIDNGDGTWEARDHGEYIDMVDPTNFIIDAPYASYLNSVSYLLSNKNE